MKIILLFSTLLWTSLTLGCELTLYKHIYKLSKNLDNKIISKSNCASTIEDVVTKFLSDINGKIPAQIVLEQAGLSNVQLHPMIISVTNLEELVNEQIELGEEKKIIELSSLTNISQIATVEEQTLNVHCESCFSNLGKVNIKLTNQDKIFWFSGKVVKKTIAWTAINSVNAFNRELSPTMFQQKIVYLDKDTDTFQEINKIRFYQSTKTINAGDVLTQAHLSPIKLVKAFSEVKLSVVGSAVSLSTDVKAKKSGYLNEYIEVVNQRSKKTFLAKIIDYNTVEIEL